MFFLLLNQKIIFQFLLNDEKLIFWNLNNYEVIKNNISCCNYKSLIKITDNRLVF